MAKVTLDQLKSFIQETKDFSPFGMNYFNIRVREYILIDDLFDGLFSKGVGKFLDIGCGFGLAAVFAGQFYDQADGIDIPEISIGFSQQKPAPLLGADVVKKLGINGVTIQCANTKEFLEQNKQAYDFILSHFVLEHIDNIAPICEAIYSALKPGASSLHVVPNTHDTILQLLTKNLNPVWQNIKNVWKARKSAKKSGNLRHDNFLGNLFVPETHSEFIHDYRQQFEINYLERYLFPMMDAGFKIKDIKPVREHAYAILLEKPKAPALTIKDIL